MAIRQRKNLALAAFMMIFLVSITGALNVSVSSDAAEAMLPTDPESIARYEDYLAHFPSDSGALVVFIDLLCSEDGWDLIKRLEASFDQHPMVDRTISLASRSARYVYDHEDLIDVSIFSEIPFESADQRCKKATEYSPFKQVLVSEDARATALFVVAIRDVDATTLSEALIETSAPFAIEAEKMGGKIILTGEPIMSAELSRVIAKDSVFVAVILLIVMFLTFFITRSWTTTWVSLCLNTFVVTSVYGFMGWFSIQQTPVTSLVLFLLVPLTSAFVIHAHGYVSRSSEDGFVPRESVAAFLMAGLTTGIGFACTGLTSAADVRSLALVGAVGIGAGTAGIFLFVFPILSRKRNKHFAFDFRLPRWVIVEPAIGIAILAILVVHIAFGLSMLKLDYGPSDYLPMSNPVRADFERAGEWFGRMTVPLVIRARDIETPEPWVALKPLIDELYDAYPNGFQASWFYDHLSEVTQAFTRDNAGRALLFPTDEATFKQLILWFDPDDLEIYMDEQRRQYAVLLQLPFIGSADYYGLKRRVDRYLGEHEIDGHIVGRVSSFFETGHRVGRDNLKGLGIGGALVFLLLLGLFRSATLALIGICINAIPVLASLALLGLTNVPIDMGSSLVAAMAFGIVIDDSTHLLVRFQQLQKTGYDPGTAVLRAVGELIAPIVTTTAIICAGFSVLYLTEMRPFHDFASVILMTMVTALIADLVILPALIRRFVRDPLSDIRGVPTQR